MPVLSEDEKKEQLKAVHRKISMELNWNEPGHEPNMQNIAGQLATALAIIGDFCDDCSGSGKTWRGECRVCDGRGY